MQALRAPISSWQPALTTLQPAAVSGKQAGALLEAPKASDLHDAALLAPTSTLFLQKAGNAAAA